MTDEERELVQMFRDGSGPIRPNKHLAAADLIERLSAEVERLRKERDEARRQVCEMCEANGDFVAKRQAEMRGWDCFKEAP